MRNRQGEEKGKKEGDRQGGGKGKKEEDSE